MSELTALYERNQLYAETHQAGLPIMPKFQTIILTCLDARIDPAHFLGLELGDALVMRNAGGRVTDDVMLDLGFLWAMGARAGGENFQGFGLALIQHTDCGLERLANPQFTSALSQRLGVPQAKLDDMANADHVQQIHDDIARLSASSLVPNALNVSGHIYDIATGRMQEIVPAAPLSR